MTALAAALPQPQGRVNDFAGVIDSATRAELTRLVQDVETRTSAEIAVVTVGSLDGMTIEEYAVKLFAAWGIGKKARDNGVLVLVAPTERRMRIEVGYGLEPILPDALAGRIIREACLPAFRNNQYALGILQGVRRVSALVIRREPAAARTEPDDGRPPVYLIIPFLGAFVVFGAFVGGAALRTRSRVGVICGGLFCLIPLLIAVATYFTIAAMTLPPLAILMTLLGYRKGGSPYWARTMRGSSETVGASTPWVSGPPSSDSNDSGSSGGDFGGGSSGGGGASGSW